MIRRRALRASSTHNICVFCATRLNGGGADAALHHLSSGTTAPAARYVQRRGISSSRPTAQTFAAAAQQQQRQDEGNWQSAQDRERNALQNRFSASATPAQTQPSATGGAIDPEKAALMARYAATPPPPPPSQQQTTRPAQPQRGFRIRRFDTTGKAGVGGQTANNQRTKFYRVQIESREQQRQQQQDGQDDPGFDPNNVRQWKHLRPRSRQQHQPQSQGAQGGKNVWRREQSHTGNTQFVPLSSGQKSEDREKFLRRFGVSKAEQAPQAPATQPQAFARPEWADAQSSSKDVEANALQARFGAGPRFAGSSSSPSQPQLEPNQRIEHDALHSRFSRVAQTVEREAPREQASQTTVIGEEASPEEIQKTEQAEGGHSLELQELEKVAVAAQEVGERERASRFSKFANVEDEAPRKRKAKGGWSKASAYDEEALNFGRAERKSKKEKKKKQRAVEVAPPTPIYLPEYLSVVNLANLLRVRTEDLVRKMEELGYEDINHDDILNAENAGLIAMEYNFEPAAADPAEDLDLYPAPEPEDVTNLPARPPVVTIMGHVDHGKTTLLDFLRKSSVAATEFGGITQHIGAFSVPLSSGKTITFLDTPGHAAFLSMRQRGANVTDIVVLVVAADDSVKPQTIEAIKHAKAARVPMIVAINKVDKEGANIERVKQDLARHGVDVEDYGGDVQAIPVSGKTGQGMKDLEEATITLSEILDHRADPEGPVEGWVLEASTKKSGKAATVLVRRGTLKIGSIIVAGKTFARVRSIRNEAGVDISSVGPGMPAEIDGWRGQPEAGDEVLEAPDEQRASEVVEYREVNAERVQLAKDIEAINEARRLEHERREREEAIAAAAKAGEEDPEAAVATAEAAEKETSGIVEVPFVVKADVSGSVEAVVDYVMTVGNGEVRPRVIRSGVGAVTESDVEYAATTGGHVVSFNVALEPRLARVAETKGVRVLEQNVIYRLVDDVKAVLSERLEPLVVQRVTGEASVLQLFSINLGRKASMNIAGCRVTNGSVTRGAKVRVIRGEEKVYDGTVSSLKHVKKDVPEMRKGSECGMAFEGWGDAQAGDSIQCYEERFEKRSL